MVSKKLKKLMIFILIVSTLCCCTSKPFNEEQVKLIEKRAMEEMERYAQLLDDAFNVTLKLDRKNVTIRNVPCTVTANLTISNPTDRDFTVWLTAEVPKALKEFGYVEAWIKVVDVKKYVYLPDVPKLDKYVVVDLPKRENVTIQVGLDVKSVAQSLKGWSGCYSVKAVICDHGGFVMTDKILTNYVSLKISFV